MQTRGISVKPEKLPEGRLKVSFLNSDGCLLKLVKFVENRRKSKKFKSDFVGFAVKNPTTFVKHYQAFS
jgi:hypothetical protein